MLIDPPKLVGPIVAADPGLRSKSIPAMNWLGKKRGEGIEYFVMLVSMLIIIVIKGSGAVSLDLWLLSKM